MLTCHPSPQEEAGYEFKASLGYTVKTPLTEQRAAVLTQILTCQEQRMRASLPWGSNGTDPTGSV